MTKVYQTALSPHQLLPTTSLKTIMVNPNARIFVHTRYLPVERYLTTAHDAGHISTIESPHHYVAYEVVGSLDWNFRYYVYLLNTPVVYGNLPDMIRAWIVRHNDVTLV